MRTRRIPSSVILAELLRLQRRAGGDSVSAGRIFGLMHGFETVVREELESFGISEKTQEKVEDLIEDVESGKQSVDGMSLKHRLHSDDIDEGDASRVIELCRLQSRHIEGVEKLINDPRSIFHHLKQSIPEEQEWTGATHYIELVDCTDGEHKKLHAVFAATVPRVGETISPQRGQRMRVVGVDYVIGSHGEHEGTSLHCLVPYVLLESIDDETND